MSHLNCIWQHRELKFKETSEGVWPREAGCSNSQKTSELCHPCESDSFEWKSQEDDVGGEDNWPSLEQDVGELIYFQRPLFLERALPTRAYAAFGIPQRPQTGQLAQLQRIRRRYTVFGLPASYAELISLRNFSRLVSRTEPPAFLLHWSEDGNTIYHGDTFNLKMDFFPRVTDD